MRMMAGRKAERERTFTLTHRILLGFFSSRDNNVNPRSKFVAGRETDLSVARKKTSANL